MKTDTEESNSVVQKCPVPAKISQSIQDVVMRLAYMTQDLWETPEASLNRSHPEWQLVAVAHLCISNTSKHAYVSP